MRIVLLWLCMMTVSYAEKIIPSLSTHRVVINSNFSGADLVLFGLIERDGVSIVRGTGYDVMVVVKGASKNFTIREKTKLFGLWVNGVSKDVKSVPSAYIALSNRRIRDVADIDIAQQNQFGLENVFKRAVNLTYEKALLRLQSDKNIYRDYNNAVTFLTPTWFRARLPLPSQIPTGQYTIEVYLLTGGLVLAKNETNFEIVKAGSEQFISNQAQTNGWLYGFVVALIALCSGILAHLIFKRD